MNRVTDIKHFKVVEEIETLLIHLEHPADEYDPLGNRKQMKRTLFPFLDGRFGTGSHVNYGYDKTSQLTAENYFRPATPNPLQFLSRTNTFDDSGNRLNLTENRGGIVKTIGGAFDEANGLEAETVRFDDVLNQQWQTVFERDLRGNTTKKTVPAGAGGEKEEFNYEYNRRNNLTKVTRTKLGEQKEIGFQYNADGLRVEKSFVGGIGVSPVVKKFIMDGVHVILEKEIVGEEDPVTVARYIPGVCMITRDYNNQPVIRYYHQDALGSTVAMTDEDQNITALYQSDAWGNELLATEDVPNPYRWNGASGYYRDNDAQLYLLGMRWYDAETGRFVSRDPIGFDGGDNNFFAYTNNSPVSYTDPRGIARISPPSALDVICLPFILLALRAVKSARNDLYKHCVLGCVIARRCGFIYCGLAGILKEDWDYYTGLGTPDWDDLGATLDGCLISFKWGTCENLCKGKFNPNLRR